MKNQDYLSEFAADTLEVEQYSVLENKRMYTMIADPFDDMQDTVVDTSSS